MDLLAAARDLRAGARTSEAVVTECLERIARLDRELRAFAWLGPDRALRLAREADALRSSGAPLGALHGVPIGIKDIIDTAGIPTEWGTPLLAGRIPERSATIVSRLEAAGAIVIGKTVTAELAYYHPGPTVNPYDGARTPGGSSMGSAAAVAADLVPGATGSQTNGSVIRPAAFCGVVGFKPSFGRIPLDGVMPFAPTLDTAGAFATTVAGAALVAAIMAGEDPASWLASPPPRVRLAIARTSDWERVDAYARQRFVADYTALSEAGASVEMPAPPAGLDGAVAALRTIQIVEGARNIAAIVERDPARASPQARALIEEGRRTPEGSYRSALALRERLVPEFAAWAAPYDAVLAVPASGEAPSTETTGDPRYCSRWTFVGAPAITLPTGLGPSGLPLGLQLVGAPGEDRRLLAAATWAESRLPRPPAPYQIGVRAGAPAR